MISKPERSHAGFARLYRGKRFALLLVALVACLDVQALKTRPRKSLNYQTPNEIFYQNAALGK